MKYAEKSTKRRKVITVEEQESNVGNESKVGNESNEKNESKVESIGNKIKRYINEFKELEKFFGVCFLLRSQFIPFLEEEKESDRLHTLVEQELQLLIARRLILQLYLPTAEHEQYVIYAHDYFNLMKRDLFFYIYGEEEGIHDFYDLPYNLYDTLLLVLQDYFLSVSHSNFEIDSKTLYDILHVYLCDFTSKRRNNTSLFDENLDFAFNESVLEHLKFKVSNVEEKKGCLTVCECMSFLFNMKDSTNNNNNINNSGNSSNSNNRNNNNNSNNYNNNNNNNNSNDVINNKNEEAYNNHCTLMKKLLLFFFPDNLSPVSSPSPCLTLSTSISCIPSIIFSFFNKKNTFEKEKTKSIKEFCNLKKSESELRNTKVRVEQIINSLFFRGFLRRKRSSGNNCESFLYSFSIPKIGTFINWLQQGNNEILKTIKRRKYKEILENDLKRKHVKASKLSIHFHILYLLASRKLQRIECPSGELLRLTCNSN